MTPPKNKHSKTKPRSTVLQSVYGHSPKTPKSSTQKPKPKGEFGFLEQGSLVRDPDKKCDLSTIPPRKGGRPGEPNAQTRSTQGE